MVLVRDWRNVLTQLVFELLWFDVLDYSEVDSRDNHEVEDGGDTNAAEQQNVPGIGESPLLLLVLNFKFLLKIDELLQLITALSFLIDTQFLFSILKYLVEISLDRVDFLVQICLQNIDGLPQVSFNFFEFVFAANIPIQVLFRYFYQFLGTLDLHHRVLVIYAQKASIRHNEGSAAKNNHRETKHEQFPAISQC